MGRIGPSADMSLDYGEELAALHVADLDGVSPIRSTARRPGASTLRQT
jgi:hypothetical protein